MRFAVLPPGSDSARQGLCSTRTTVSGDGLRPYQKRSPSRRASNWARRMRCSVGPTMAPGRWSSANPTQVVGRGVDRRERLLAAVQARNTTSDAPNDVAERAFDVFLRADQSRNAEGHQVALGMPPRRGLAEVLAAP